MKTKEICNACVDKQTKNGWTSFDEDGWAMGLHYCPVEKKVVDVEKTEIPKNCFYYLEYIMKEQKL